VDIAFGLLHAVDQRHQGGAGVGQIETAAAPVEQLDAVLFFQLLDASRDGRLTDFEPLGGGGDTALPDGFVKGNQKRSKHGRPKAKLPTYYRNVTISLRTAFDFVMSCKRRRERADVIPCAR